MLQNKAEVKKSTIFKRLRVSVCKTVITVETEISTVRKNHTSLIKLSMSMKSSLLAFSIS